VFWGARTLAGFLLAGAGAAAAGRQAEAHETHFPAQQAQAGSQSRFSRAHGHEGRAARFEAPAREGPGAAHAVGGRGGSNGAAATEQQREPANKNTRRPYRLRAADRLSDTADFSRVFSGARRSRDRYFTVLSKPNGRRSARLGLAISKKHCRLASGRNRLKRIVRESFRRHRPELASVDIVVMAQPGTEAVDNATLFDSLDGHWQGIRRAPQPDQQ
jgi:ribonuclease P protein component